MPRMAATFPVGSGYPSQAAALPPASTFAAPGGRLNATAQHRHATDGHQGHVHRRTFTDLLQPRLDRVLALHSPALSNPPSVAAVARPRVHRSQAVPKPHPASTRPLMPVKEPAHCRCHRRGLALPSALGRMLTGSPLLRGLPSNTCRCSLLLSLPFLFDEAAQATPDLAQPSRKPGLLTASGSAPAWAGSSSPAQQWQRQAQIGYGC